MPIAGAVMAFKNGIQGAYSMGKVATVKTSSQLFMASLASSVSMGLKPVGTSMVPLVPSGVSTAISSLVNALSMGKSAQIRSTSIESAMAISKLAPLCPPSGVSGLGSSMTNALSQGKCATVERVSMEFAIAIVQYYMSGGIL